MYQSLHSTAIAPVSINTTIDATCKPVFHCFPFYSAPAAPYRPFFLVFRSERPLPHPFDANEDLDEPRWQAIHKWM